MSIGRRIINMARAELNSLLDKAAQFGSDDDDDSAPDLSRLSADELAEEIRRRREAEEEIEELLGNRPRRPQQQQQQQRQPPPRHPGPASTADEVRRAYAALEVPYGSGFEAVRKSYRQLMRKYHPDHHTQSPEKQKAANEVCQRLTLAYRLLEKQLRR